MFRYFARLHEKFGLPIFPVAVFSFDKPLRPEPDRYRVDFPKFRVLDFVFRAIQLNRLNWRDFLRNPTNPVASALMTKMRIAPGDRPRVKLECLRMLATLKLDKARATLIGALMTSYLKLTSAETAVYNEMLKAVEPREREDVMQLTNEWIEQGIRKGLQKGRQEGRRNLVLRRLPPAAAGGHSGEIGKASRLPRRCRDFRARRRPSRFHRPSRSTTVARATQRGEMTLIIPGPAPMWKERPSAPSP